MYAIVDIAGQQFKVEKDQKVYVHRLEGKEGTKLEFDRVLLIDNDKSVVVGTPVISGAMVKAEIVDHLKGDKVVVFRKKRRKGFKVKNGHRQYLTQVVIQDIIEKGAKKTEVKAEPKPAAKSVAKEESPKAETKAPAAKKPVAKTTTKPAAKTAAKPPTKAAAKPAAKSTETKKAAPKTTASKPAAKKTATKTAAKNPAAKKTDSKS